MARKRKTGRAEKSAGASGGRVAAGRTPGRARPLGKSASGIIQGGVSGIEADAAARHVPVLLGEVLDFFQPAPGGRYLDGTLGLGGHSAAMLQKIAASGASGCALLGLDRDAEALSLARGRLEPLVPPDAALYTAKAEYSFFGEEMDRLGWPFLHFALLDIGVSSLQLDEAERGFSLAANGPLDMRMDPGKGQSAAALVNRAPVERLKELIETCGEDPLAGRIARAIDDARAVKPLESTLELARVVESAYPAKWRATARNHPATRTFQALRMAVNDELGELERFLHAIVGRLAPGGLAAIITFHSLEDRMVKHFFRTEATGCLCPRSLPICSCGHSASLAVLTKKPVTPSEAELLGNPRAGSAKLRVARRLGGA